MFKFFLISICSLGPEVGLDSDYLDMGVVESSKFSAKSFKVVNNSDVPAVLEWEELVHSLW